MSGNSSPWLVLIDVSPEIFGDVLARQLERPDMTITRGRAIHDDLYDVTITTGAPSASGASAVLELHLGEHSRARGRRPRERVLELRVTDVASVRRTLEVLCPRRFARS